ncbi:uncharacterized protein METZ01_LOCUS312325 [marine metagenome]|uniref:Uncharacterized protein n=1 Tax=marine metagenome TaxID=408172 RepID=A0A382NIR8_9ZZZZ
MVGCKTVSTSFLAVSECCCESCNIIPMVMLLQTGAAIPRGGFSL